MSLEIGWMLYALLATSLIGGFFLWAVRAGQFTDQDRARYLPLVAGEKIGLEPQRTQRVRGEGPH